MRTVQHGKYTVHEDGTVIGRGGRPLRPDTVKGGYLRVRLSTGEGVVEAWLVHRLVAHLFIGACPPRQQVNHRDGDKTNNQVANLEYVTPAENVRHSLDVLGVKRARGEANSRSSLTDQQVRSIRAARATGTPLAELARTHDIHPSTVWRIATGRAWSHVA